MLAQSEKVLTPFFSYEETPGRALGLLFCNLLTKPKPKQRNYRWSSKSKTKITGGMLSQEQHL